MLYHGIYSDGGYTYIIQLKASGVRHFYYVVVNLFNVILKKKEKIIKVALETFSIKPII